MCFQDSQKVFVFLLLLEPRPRGVPAALHRLARHAQHTGGVRVREAAEQAQLIRFTGFGASELANGVFRRPGDDDFRDGWEEIGAALESAVGAADYASLARCTQYAHFTPEYIVRAVWAGVTRLGFRGGRVLEPGIGTGLFSALMPEKLRGACYLTGVELDPVTFQAGDGLYFVGSMARGVRYLTSGIGFVRAMVEAVVADLDGDVMNAPRRSIAERSTTALAAS